MLSIRDGQRLGGEVDASWYPGVDVCLKVRSDWFVYVVLSCLPWVGKELYEKKDVEMDRLLSQIEGFLK